VRIRGNAIQVHEKYLGLARDAASAGDRVAAENYYQHAEHYFRIYSVDQEERAQRQSGSGQAGDQQRRHAGNGGGQPNGHARNDERGEVNGNGNTNGVNGEESPTVALAPESAIELPDSEEDEEAASASADEPQQQKPARRPRRRRPASSD
jgi:hypothetical protein